MGAEIEVPTLDGNVKYTIPEGTQSGTVFRLKGKGIPFLQRSGRGAQYVKVNVEVPKHLSSKQKALLKEFAELDKDGIRPEFNVAKKRRKENVDGKQVYRYHN